MNVDIVEEIGEVVSKTASELNQTIYYMYGHPLEIVNNLVELTKSPKSKNKKFPLIALFTDITVDRNKPAGMFGTATLHLIIANITDKDYKAPERLQHNFKPILQPIKNEFINQVEKHKQFTYDDELRFRETERYYWGKSANTFNDYIDCIEIEDLKINIKNKSCSPPNNL